MPMRQRTQVRELQRQGNASLVMALAGNKADLTEKRKVDSEVPFLPPAPAKSPRFDLLLLCYPSRFHLVVWQAIDGRFLPLL